MSDHISLARRIGAAAAAGDVATLESLIVEAEDIGDAANVSIIEILIRSCGQRPGYNCGLQCHWKLIKYHLLSAIPPELHAGSCHQRRNGVPTAPTGP